MALVDRVKAICLKPKEEWDVIASETTSAADLIKNYALPLAAIGAVAGFIGMSFVGFSILGVTVRTPIANGLVAAVLYLALSLVGAYLFGLIIEALAPQVGAEKDRAQALKVAIYSLTPGWVGSVVAIVPNLWPLWLIAACYGIYVLHLGLLRLMKCPPEKASTYTALAALCGAGVTILIRVLARTAA
jgi:hypothetical protein